MNEFEQQEALFERCLELPPRERQAFVRSQCGDNAELCQAVLELLRSHETAGGFLESLPDEDSDLVAQRLQRIAPAEESPGDQIGRYRLLELIGEGAWGSVWMAQQTVDIDRRVALKILKLGLDTRDFLARFEAERQMLAMMDHPNIAHVLDAGATDFGRPYLVMELVKGMPLLEYADKKRLSIADRVQLFIKVCSALQHAHQKGIIHRDLKPSNILVSVQDDEAVPKVIDFGVAKTNQFRLTDKTLFTSIHTFIGTPVYSSPEQLEFTGMDVDPRSDVYSLGALLYEFLCGKTPFDYDKASKEGMSAFRTLVQEKVPPTPSTRFAALPEDQQAAIAAKRQCTIAKVKSRVKGDLDWIVMQCLEKEPPRRYPSAQALGQDLQAYLDGDAVSAGAPSLWYRTRKLITRNRPAHAIWAEVTAGIFAVLFIAALFWPRPPGPPPVEFELNQRIEETTLAVLPLANHIPNVDKAYFADAIHEEIFTQLGIINDLRVTGIASVRQYRDTQKTARQIGEELQVRYLINGSVYLDDNRASITLRLSDTLTDQQIWADTYNRSTDDLFTLRSAIAKDVAEQLQVVLSPEERIQISEFPTQNREAYDYFLKGKTLSWPDNLDVWRRAVELDPSFYQAWGHIITTSLYSYRVRSKKQDAELLEIARNALEQLERSTADRSLFLRKKGMWSYNIENDLLTATTLAEEAFAADPNHWEANGDLALRYNEVGRVNEALPLLEEAHDLDPLGMGIIQRLFLTYQLLGMWDEGRSLIRKAREHSDYYREFFAGFLPTLNYIESGDLEAYIKDLEIEEHGGDSRSSLVWPALISREYQKALDLLEEDEPNLLQLLAFPGRGWPSTFSLEPFDLGKALIYFQLDDKEQWQALAEKAGQELEAWIQDPYADPSHRYNLAICYALLGERDPMDKVIEEVREQIKSPNWAYRRGVLAEMHIAVAYIILGEHKKALESLEAANKMDGSIFLHRELQLWFIFDRLKGNPRFEALLRGEVLSPEEYPQADLPEKSIAVLPLENLSPDPDNAYFCDAIHSEILNNLGNISDLQVTGATSVRQYRGTVKTLQQIGKELGVRYLIEGSVFRGEDQAAIDLKLIDAQTGLQTWAETYERSTENLFSLRSAIAKDVAEQLQIVLSPEEAVLVAEFPTDNREAYDYFLRAQEVGNYGDRLSNLERATQLDQNFREAWSHFAWTSLFAYSGDLKNDPLLIRKAENAIQQVVRLRPDHFRTLNLQAGYELHVNKDIVAALDYRLKSRVAGGSGRDLGWNYLQMGELEVAVELLENALPVEPENPISYFRLYSVYVLLGTWAKARSLMETLLEKMGTNSLNLFQARQLDKAYLYLARLGFLQQGGKKKLVEALNELQEFLDESPGNLWKTLIGRDYEGSLQLLEDYDRPTVGFDLQDRLLGSFELEPVNLLAALIYHQLGDADKVSKEVAKAISYWDKLISAHSAVDPDYYANLAICYALEGERKAFESLIPRIREQTRSVNWQYRREAVCEMKLAIAYLVLGDNNKAFELLENAIQLHSPMFIHRELELWFMFDRLRGNPRFEALLQGEVLVRKDEGKRMKVEAQTDVSEKSIAVLPLENLGGGEEEATYTDGFHRELITNLSGIQDLTTIARRSTLVYRDPVKPLNEIGEELGVNRLVTGTVRWAGDQLRVTVELADAQSQGVLWSKNYSGYHSPQEIFDIQEDICQSIAGELELVLSGEEQSSIAQVPTQNEEALKAYWKGRELMDQENLALRDEVIEQFRKAVTLDPDFVLAWAYLGLAHLRQPPPARRYPGDTEKMRQDAEAAIARARELDDNLPEVYLAQGSFLWRRSNYEEAQAAYEKALQLNPNFVPAHLALISLANRDFRDPEPPEKLEILSRLDRILELDPNNAEIHRERAKFLRGLGCFDEAQAALERAIQLNPDVSVFYQDLGRLMASCRGRYDEAIRYLREAIARESVRPMIHFNIAGMYSQLGDFNESRRWAKVAEATGFDRWREPTGLLIDGLSNEFSAEWLEDNRSAIRHQNKMTYRVPLLNHDLRSGKYELALERYREWFPELFEAVIPKWERHWGYTARDALEVAMIHHRRGELQRAKYLMDLAWNEYSTFTRMGFSWMGSTGYGIKDAHIFALRGEKEKALEALREAVDTGFRNRFEFEYYALDPIREEPEFKELMEIVEKDLAEQLANVRRTEANHELAPIPQEILKLMEE